MSKKSWNYFTGIVFLSIKCGIALVMQQAGFPMWKTLCATYVFSFLSLLFAIWFLEKNYDGPADILMCAIMPLFGVPEMAIGLLLCQWAGPVVWFIYIAGYAAYLAYRFYRIENTAPSEEKQEEDFSNEPDFMDHPAQAVCAEDGGPDPDGSGAVEAAGDPHEKPVL